jgi:RimJ/RimL family protein N-acetyltransferase
VPSSSARGIAPSLWPLAGLRLRSGDVELRPPADEELPALAELFPPDVAFDPTLPVPPGESCEQARQAVLRHIWRSRAELARDDWRLCFAAYVDGELVGQQDLKAVDFPTRRIVESSSWVGAQHRGRGYAKAMRAIVLHLAFEGLGARAAESESAEGNDAALGVTRSLGYTPSGDTYAVHDGVVEHMLWSRLPRERWALQRQGYGVPPVTIEGLEPCLPLLGLAGERT